MLSQAERPPRSDQQRRPFPERRRKIRHKVHSPAYATRDHDSNIILPHLNEIVDIGEDGMCFQNSSPLEPGEKFKLCLDLSETNAHIETEGEVVWSNDSGRAGVRFHRVSKESLQQLQEWLFANNIVACVNHSDSDVAARLDVSSPLEPASLTSLLPDHTSALAAVAAIEREIYALGPDVDAALQVIADRALVLTRATGAAIALAGGENMICRASSGSDAPPVGAMLKVGSGFSGECVRSGQLLHCEDSETDPRVDRESCKALGVRSMVAAPVRTYDSVQGILEVFSPQARTFTASDQEILQRLADIVSQAIMREASPAHGDPGVALEPASETEENPGSSRILRLLIALVAAAVISAVALIVIPKVRSKSSDPVPAAQHPQTAHPVRADSLPDSLDALRHLAEQGDATAQFALGARYATGDGAKQDYSEAARWFQFAADQGDSKAQSVLAAYYWDGTGVQKDLGKAYFWAILARADQDEPSKARAAELAARLTYDQRAAIQQQAEDWIHQHTGRSSAASR
jgi:hypothetical protein